MKRISVLLLAAVAVSSHAFEKPVAAVQEMLVGMQVEIAPDGRITRVVPDAKLPAALQQLLIKRVSQWRYRPVRWQGRAVATTDLLALRVQPVPAQGGYALRVIDEGNPHVLDPAYRVFVPRFPPVAAAQGIDATLIYALAKDAQGKVGEATLLEPQRGAPGIRELDKASREALARSSMAPTLIDGAAVACRALIPVDFRADGAGGGARPDPDPRQKPPINPQVEEWRTEIADACPLPMLATPIAGTLL